MVGHWNCVDMKTCYKASWHPFHILPSKSAFFLSMFWLVIMIRNSHICFILHCLKMDMNLCNIYSLNSTKLKRIDITMLQFVDDSIWLNQITGLDKCICSCMFGISLVCKFGFQKRKNVNRQNSMHIKHSRNGRWLKLHWHKDQLQGKSVSVSQRLADYND